MWYNGSGGSDPARIKKEESIMAKGSKKDEQVQVQAQKPVEVNEKPELVLLSSGKWAIGPTVVITCEECGAERVIKKQDEFQVTKCVACQKKSLNRRRYEKKRDRKREERAEAKLAEAYKLVAEAEAARKAQEQQEQ
jgi:hypothetical protein